MVVWICGLSGSGKTTLGRVLQTQLKKAGLPAFLLDGDQFRWAVGDSLGHSPDDRTKNALRIARFCELLDAQDIHVICCAVTIPPMLQQSNRSTFSGYCEVFLEVSLQTVMNRDHKGLYAKCLRGELKNLPGVDMQYEPPVAPHLVLNNDKDAENLDDLGRQIMDLAFASTSFR
jgi:cytidine diphosphoramidate kinase